MKIRIILLTIICTTMAFSSCGDRGGNGETGAAVHRQPEAPAKDTMMVDVQPVPIKTVQPKYPDVALKAGVEGTVWLSTLVTDQGNVGEIKVMKLSPNLKDGNKSSGLPESAMEAVKQWKFKPAQLNGKAVQVWVVIPVAFKLDKDKKK